MKPTEQMIEAGAKAQFQLSATAASVSWVDLTRAALEAAEAARPKPEPVGYVAIGKGVTPSVRALDGCTILNEETAAGYIPECVVTLYAEPPAQAEQVEYGWLVENGKEGQELRYRTWENGLPAWTSDNGKATRYARRIDAERAYQEDEDAWRIVEHAWPAEQQPQELSDERTLFEQWKKANRGFYMSRNNTPGTDPEGYQDPLTNMQWESWKARAVIAAAEQQQPAVPYATGLKLKVQQALSKLNIAGQGSPNGVSFLVEEAAQLLADGLLDDAELQQNTFVFDPPLEVKAKDSRIIVECCGGLNNAYPNGAISEPAPVVSDAIREFVEQQPPPELSDEQIRTIWFAAKDEYEFARMIIAAATMRGVK